MPLKRFLLCRAYCEYISLYLNLDFNFGLIKVLFNWGIAVLAPHEAITIK